MCGKACSAWVTALLVSLLAAACAQPVATPPATPPATAVAATAATAALEPAILESLAQAQALASFSLLEPKDGTLPAGLQLTQVLWWPPSAQGAEVVTLSYQAGQRNLAITETRLPSSLAAPREPHSTVKVRGQTGYLRSTGSAHLLTWEDEERGIRMGMTVSAANLSADEVLAVSAGLRPLVIGAGLSREEAISAALKIALSPRPEMGGALGPLKHVQAELTTLASALQRLGGGEAAGRSPEMSVWLVTMEGEWPMAAPQPAGSPTQEPYRHYAVVFDATTGEEIRVSATR